MDTWTKSSHSNNSGGECVEARTIPPHTAVDVRDSQHPEHGHLTFDTTEWRAFLAEAERL
ncbi:DUF397 domain-containing protein [Halostreptopolyspora alba]|uniref:DUF397 domain-containing protein n=1 Tax=Halostreptopolyspora alba TaxID=2487137 RepID=A0A3N0E4T0_9ACTN|nr:DUF397 domain-containing protein [Nocardiopsaceae bacterium YIM 96095]